MFEDLLGRFAVQSRDSHDNRELGDTSISWDQGFAVSRSSGSDEDIDGSSDYDANIGTATPSGQLSGHDLRGLAQHLQSLGD